MATLRALIRAAMTPEDRREFDAFVERLRANEKLPKPKEAKQ